MVGFSVFSASPRCAADSLAINSSVEFMLLAVDVPFVAMATVPVVALVVEGVDVSEGSDSSEQKSFVQSQN